MLFEIRQDIPARLKHSLPPLFFQKADDDFKSPRESASHDGFWRRYGDVNPQPVDDNIRCCANPIRIIHAILKQTTVASGRTNGAICFAVSEVSFALTQNRISEQSRTAADFGRRFDPRFAPGLSMYPKQDRSN